MKLRPSPQCRAGFTLLEIMLVVAIIVLLLGLAIHQMLPQLEIARIAKATADIEAFKTSLMSYESMAGTLPSTEQGLKAMVERPEGEPKPRNWVRCIESIPNDPWGTPYLYKRPTAHGAYSGYDLYSAGPDRQADTADDIVNWKK